MKWDVFVETLKACVAAFGAWVSGVPWMAILTGAYIVLQVAYLARKWWREEQSKLREDDS